MEQTFGGQCPHCSKPIQVNVKADARVTVAAKASSAGVRSSGALGAPPARSRSPRTMTTSLASAAPVAKASFVATVAPTAPAASGGTGQADRLKCPGPWKGDGRCYNGHPEAFPPTPAMPLPNFSSHRIDSPKTLGAQLAVGLWSIVYIIVRWTFGRSADVNIADG